MLFSLWLKEKNSKKMKKKMFPNNRIKNYSHVEKNSHILDKSFHPKITFTPNKKKNYEKTQKLNTQNTLVIGLLRFKHFEKKIIFLFFFQSYNFQGCLLEKHQNYVLYII
jgi:hypothetical protein